MSFANEFAAPVRKIAVNHVSGEGYIALYYSRRNFVFSFFDWTIHAIGDAIRRLDRQPIEAVASMIAVVDAALEVFVRQWSLGREVYCFVPSINPQHD